MADYTRKAQILVKRGMNLTLPGDRLSQEWFQYLQNVRSYIAGEWRQRPGSTLLYTAGDNNSIYYITRINDASAGTYRRLVATSGGNVYVDNSAHNSLSSVDSGFSGKRYSSVISRPDRSPRPFVFLGSDTRNSKFSTTGARTEWGLAAPTTAPTVETQGLNYALVDNCNATTGFSAGGAGATLTAPSRVNTTITAILYDVSAPSMASVIPASSANVNAGMLLTFQSTEETVVNEVFPAIASTTIGSISYDSGSSGPCTIQLVAPSTGLMKNSILLLNSSERVRVRSVTIGPDGIPSLRTSTSGTFSATQTVAGQASFRCYLESTYVATNTITSNFLQVAPTTVGLVTVSKTASLNLAIANVSEGGLAANRPVQSTDFLHIGIRGTFTSLEEIQIRFDVDSATNDFTRNYYFIAVRQPDLQGAIGRTQSAPTAQQTQIQRLQIDEFVRTQLQKSGFSLSDQQLSNLGDLERKFLDQLNSVIGTGFEIGEDNAPVSLPADPGDSQWTELFLPMSAFQRVGTDETRTWANVAAFQVTFQTTGTPNYGIDDIWVGGTYGPDTNDLPPYSYIYRARNTSTGSRSNPSPPIRSPIETRRRLVKVDIPSYADSQADVIDIFRSGGILGGYFLVGTVPNSSASFNDDIEDGAAIRNPQLEVDRFKPWPRPDLPKSGTCNVIGTTVLQLGGDTFNTAWVRGTIIQINGKVYTLYTNPSSTTRLELNENAGTQSNVSFSITEPLLDGQALPAVFGPYSGAGGEFTFAVGDPTNPGFLVWTNGNDPESASDVNFLELCSPSEKLMNGCVLDGIIYCFSNRRSWRILPSFSGGQTGAGSDFYPQETAMGKGLAARYGLCVGDYIYFVSHDGIYRSRGDAVESITTESLAPLFRRDGSNTTFSAPVSAINFVNEDEIRLVFSYDGLYFHYQGLDNNRYTFHYSELTQGWTLDIMGTTSIIMSSREIQTPDTDNVIIGGTAGRVLIRSNTAFSDNGVAIAGRIWDREELWDDIRSTKQIADIMIDAAPQGATITPTARYEDNTVSDVLSTITGSGRDQFVRDISSGIGRTARGVALDLNWNDGTAGAPRFYAWEPAALIKADEQVNRATDWDNGGGTHEKWLQGFYLRADTGGVAKSFRVETDGGTVVESFTITSTGERTQVFSLTNPVVCQEMRLVGEDNDVWRNFGVQWIWEPEPERALTWETQVTNLDLPFYHHIREVMIAHRSTANITMTVSTDSTSNAYTIVNGGGQRIRTYLPLKGIKAKYHKFRFTSSQAFGLWIADIEVRAGAWSRTEKYYTVKPFGDISRSNGGARI